MCIRDRSSARQELRFIAVVVLPTPPFWLVIAIVLALSLSESTRSPYTSLSSIMNILLEPREQYLISSLSPQARLDLVFQTLLDTWAFRCLLVSPPKLLLLQSRF